MSADRRQANKNWYTADEHGASSWDQIQIAVLMDIRDELQRHNRLMYRAGNLLHAIHWTLQRRPRKISLKQAAQRLARARNRRRR